MDLVQHDESASVICEDILPVRRPNKKVFKHHVVREDDVGGSAPHPFPVRLFGPPVVLLDGYGAFEAGGFQDFLDASRWSFARAFMG
jgi:hypothetical protein